MVQDLVDLLAVVAEDVLHVGSDDLGLPEIRHSLVDLLGLEVGVGFVLGDAQHEGDGGEHGPPCLSQVMKTTLC